LIIITFYTVTLAKNLPFGIKIKKVITLSIQIHELNIAIKKLAYK